jgi:1-acyl-sn-glycerol-3-phosphate acyltransferase
MLNFLVIVSIIILFSYYEILLTLFRLLAPGRAFETTEGFAHRAVRHIFRLMHFYCGVDLEYENLSGIDLPERFLLVANHQSLMDIPVCIALFPRRMLRFVAKWELRVGIPFVSFILRTQGHALVRRNGEATQAMRSIRRYARRCRRENTCPVIFPEGTRSPDGEVGVFHTAGVRKILEETALPLVVAVLDGGWKVANMEGIARNLNGARFRIHVLRVTPTLSAKKEVLDAVSRAREEIATALAALRVNKSELTKKPPNGGSLRKSN